MNNFKFIIVLNDKYLNQNKNTWYFCDKLSLYLFYIKTSPWSIFNNSFVDYLIQIKTYQNYKQNEIISQDIEKKNYYQQESYTSKNCFVKLSTEQGDVYFYHKNNSYFYNSKNQGIQYEISNLSFKCVLVHGVASYIRQAQQNKTLTEIKFNRLFFLLFTCEINLDLYNLLKNYKLCKNYKKIMISSLINCYFTITKKIFPEYIPQTSVLKNKQKQTLTRVLLLCDIDYNICVQLSSEAIINNTYKNTKLFLESLLV